MSTRESTREQLVSADGTVITYEVRGNGGPGLVVVPGGTRTGYHYDAMADELAKSFTIYAINRRGRAGSGPQQPGHRIDDDCADVAALLEKTGSELLFGHSYGGLVALETVLRTPISKLAVYEPAVSIGGSIPSDWIFPYGEKAADARWIDCLVVMMKGLKLAGPLRWIPNIALRPMLRMATGSSNEMKDWPELAPTLIPEAREVFRLDSTVDRYREITTPTRLLLGNRSPAYLREAIYALDGTIPHAITEVLHGCGHNAPDQDAPRLVAERLSAFLNGGT